MTDGNVPNVPSMARLSVNTSSDNECMRLSFISDMMKVAYETWMSPQMPALDYVRCWPQITESPWTPEGAKKRLSINISSVNPFTVVAFYRLLSTQDKPTTDRLVDQLMEGCTSMKQLAENITRVLAPEVFQFVDDYRIDIRGRADCEETHHVRYLYKSTSSPVCISTPATQYDTIQKMMLQQESEFFIYPSRLKALNYLKYVINPELWKILDLFMGYGRYLVHDTGTFNDCTHMYESVEHFMNHETGHDADLKQMVYGRCGLTSTTVEYLRTVASTVVSKLGRMISDVSKDTLEAVLTSEEMVFMVDMRENRGIAYTYNQFFSDECTFRKNTNLMLSANKSN